MRIFVFFQICTKYCKTPLRENGKSLCIANHEIVIGSLFCWITGTYYTRGFRTIFAIPSECHRLLRKSMTQKKSTQIERYIFLFGLGCPPFLKLKKLINFVHFCNTPTTSLPSLFTTVRWIFVRLFRGFVTFQRKIP